MRSGACIRNAGQAVGTHAFSTATTNTELLRRQVGTWEVDLARSEIAASLQQSLLGASGKFTRYDVVGSTADGIADWSVLATIDMASLETGNRGRDRHLKALLEVTAHPTATYRSSGIRESGTSWIIDGELTLCGVTREMPLTVELADFTNEASGVKCARFSGTAEISRKRFGFVLPFDRLFSDVVHVHFVVTSVLQP